MEYKDEKERKYFIVLFIVIPLWFFSRQFVDVCLSFIKQRNVILLTVSSTNDKWCSLALKDDSEILVLRDLLVITDDYALKGAWYMYFH